MNTRRIAAWITALALFPPLAARADDAQKIDVKVGAPIITKTKTKHVKKPLAKKAGPKRAEKK